MVGMSAGLQGHRLIDSSGERPRLRYVFDVSDTGGREFPKSRYLWEYREEHADAVSAMLESRYGVDGKEGFPTSLSASRLSLRRNTGGTISRISSPSLTIPFFTGMMNLT